MEAAVSLDQYLRAMKTDYLEYYIARGGATVKVGTASEPTRGALSDALLEQATRAGYHCATLNAGDVRISKLEDVWFSIARQIDWVQTGRDFLKNALFPRFDIDGEDYSLDGIARKNGLERWVVQRALDEILSARLLRAKGLSGEFRRAMFSIVGSLLAPVGIVSNVAPYVLKWLRGELASIIPIKSAMLYRRVNKTNARQMLVSLSRWLRECGAPGLVIVIDIARISAADRSVASLSYARVARIDCYEVIRQFIDSTDSMSGLGLWFLADESLVDDEVRGMHLYPALEMRLAQDVHDRQRSNPFAPLVRVI